MEKGIKEKRFLVLSCATFAASLVFLVKYVGEGLNSASGFNTPHLLKDSPFFMIALSMAIYSVGLFQKLKNSN